MPNESDLRDAEPVVDGRTYDACYFGRYGGRTYQRNAEWLTFFAGIADRIAADVRPARVLDAGCALGLLVETLRAKGIEAFGIDFSAFAIEQVYEPVKPFCRQASVTEPLRDQYDLVVCFEVLEHLTAADGETAIANFCAHSRDILFSSSPDHYGEPTHLNTQPAEYWATRFARHDFFRDVDFDASFVAPWAVRFRHRTDPPHLHRRRLRAQLCKGRDRAEPFARVGPGRAGGAFADHPGADRRSSGAGADAAELVLAAEPRLELAQQAVARQLAKPNKTDQERSCCRGPL